MIWRGSWRPERVVGGKRINRSASRGAAKNALCKKMATETTKSVAKDEKNIP